MDKPRNALVISLIALLAGSGSLTACSPSIGTARGGKPEQGGQKEIEKSVTVAVAKVARENLAQRLTIAAEFRPMQEIDLHAKVAGYLKEIRVDLGDQVRQGQVIATLEAPEFKSDLTQAAAARKRSESDVARARSEAQRAGAVYDAAKLTYERLSGVSKSRPNLLAQQEVDDAQAKMLVADAQVSAAKAALAVAEEQAHVQEAGEERVKTIAEYTTIIVPFTGVITKRYADLGAMIQAGTASQTQAMPVVRLSQVDHLRLVLPVPESAVPQIHNGGPVAVKIPSLDQTFDGRVSRFSGKVDPSTRTMETEVDVPNPRYLLKPGMYASASLELDRRPNAVTAPVQAVARKDGKATVMLVNAQRKLEPREIVTGLETPENVEVVSGLNEGDLVVIGNLSQLKPGMVVEPKLATLGDGAKTAKAAEGGGK
jgi:RND family efflux transporter MFP subunit